MTPRNVMVLPDAHPPQAGFGERVNLERFLNRLPAVSDATVAGWAVTEWFIATGGAASAEALRILGELAATYAAPDLSREYHTRAIQLGTSLGPDGNSVVARARLGLDALAPDAPDAADRDRRTRLALPGGTPGRAAFVRAGQVLLAADGASFAAARGAAVKIEEHTLPSLEPSPSASLAARRDLIFHAVELLPAVMAMPSDAEMRAFTRGPRSRMPKRTRTSETFANPPTLDLLGSLADDRERARNRYRDYREQHWFGATKPPADPYATTGGCDQARIDLAKFSGAVRFVQGVRAPAPSPLSPRRVAAVLSG